jgi:hypothetical protein
LKNVDVAKRISRHLEHVLNHYSTDFFNGRHIEALHRILVAEIHLYDKDLNKAIRTGESAMKMINRHDLKLLSLMNYQTLNQIYQRLSMEKQHESARQEVATIWSGTRFKQSAPLLLN